MQESAKTAVDELVVLQKFEGDPLPENEFERLTIHNGVVVAHEEVSGGEVTGPVADSELLGVNIGTLTSQSKEEN